MSTLTASVAAASSEKKNSTNKPPMEEVIVNSIIYSKPSFCRISVDLGGGPVNKNCTSKIKMTNADCPNNMDYLSEANCSPLMESMDSSLSFNVACMAGMATSSSLNSGEDAKLYRMCTTLNGSIHHHISDLCDNIFAMAEFYNTANSDHDDDSFIEFAYRDEGEEDYNDVDEDDEDEADFIDNEDECNYEADDDYDVVDFSYDCPIMPAPKLYCNKKKKVRFNTNPTVHIMHTWNYAYRAARKGEWEMYARDRERFKLRVQRTALILNPILKREHRQKIYEKRFANLHNKDDIPKNVFDERIESKENCINTESKKPHQKTKRKKKRFCKMGNKHYF